MKKKEFYRQALPHFQHPGQVFFVTWCLKDAVPPKALELYTNQLKRIKSEIEIAKTNNADSKIINDLKIEFYRIRKKYMKAFDDLLHLQTSNIINLSSDENTKIITESLIFWDGKHIENYAFCIMSNHVHWVFRVFEKDENGKVIYLQDVLQSVKRYSATKINKARGSKGNIWQKESYDTTIRDNLHLHNAINYTLENPAAAGLVKNWWDWSGTKLFIQ